MPSVLGSSTHLAPALSGAECAPVLPAAEGAPVSRAARTPWRREGGHRGRTVVRHGWVTGSGRALATRVDEPVDGRARGALVVVPSSAREAVVSFRAVRALAVRAAEAGFVGVSAALSGEGDSEGVGPDEDLAQCWRDDVAAVVAAARELAGGGPVHVVGLRLGATLVHELPAAQGEVRLLWEPVSGSAFVRQQRRLRALAVPSPVAPDGVELYGAHLSQAHGASLTTLTAPKTRGGRAPSGVGIRMEADREVAAHIAGVSPHDARIPTDAIDEIVAGLPRGPQRPVVAGVLSASTRIAAPGGRHVVETHVAVGPHGLHGVLTCDPAVETVGGLVFTAMGVEQSDGPGGLFVESARVVAALGVASLRCDRRLLGEDLDISAPTEPRPYVESSVTDVAEAIRFLADRVGGPVTGVGVCAGAWSLLKASPRCPLAEVLAVNPVHWAPDESAYGEEFYAATYGQDSTFAQRLTGEPAAVTGAAGVLVAARARVARAVAVTKHVIATHAPTLKALVCREPRPPRIRVFFEHVAPAVGIHVLLGTWERNVFTAHAGRQALRARRALGSPVTVQVDPRLDHSLMSTAARDAARAAIEAAARRAVARARPVAAR